MKNNALKKGLTGLVLGATLGLGVFGISGCQKDYDHMKELTKRIENSPCHFSQRDKKEILEEYSSIDLDNLNENEKNFLNQSYEDKMKKVSERLIFEYLCECGIIMPDKEKLSERDFLLMHHYMSNVE